MRVLHITSHNENCGIGIYQENYVNFMEEIRDKNEVAHDFFPYSPTYNRSLTRRKFKQVIASLESVIDEYDLVHMQHEYAFYAPYQLKEFVKVIKSHNKPLVTTIHTNPVPRKTKRSIFTIKGVLARARNLVLNKIYLDAFLPLREADSVLVHNTFTRDNLIELGFPAENVHLWMHPVYVSAPNAAERFKASTDAVNKALDRQKGDVLIATVGYINITKGGLRAVKTLSMLPENYKLVMIGGIHPTAHNDEELDVIADTIVNLGLQDRVHVTGHIANDAEFDALIQNADIICYVYDKAYASSSGAVNKAISNHRPIVATPVKAFIEMNNDTQVMRLSASFSHLDTARDVEYIAHHKDELSTQVVKYAEKHSFRKYAEKMVDLYETLINEKA